MPRHNGNTPSRDPRHHGAMHSPAHGKGLSARLRLRKRELGASRKKAPKKQAASRA